LENPGRIAFEEIVDVKRRTGFYSYIAINGCTIDCEDGAQVPMLSAISALRDKARENSLTPPPDDVLPRAAEQPTDPAAHSAAPTSNLALTPDSSTTAIMTRTKVLRLFACQSGYASAALIFAGIVFWIADFFDSFKVGVLVSSALALGAGGLDWAYFKAYRCDERRWWFDSPGEACLSTATSATFCAGILGMFGIDAVRITVITLCYIATTVTKEGMKRWRIIKQR
jgi:hypothetical protein